MIRKELIMTIAKAATCGFSYPELIAGHNERTPGKTAIGSSSIAKGTANNAIFKRRS
jgi:hypothetical protein